jgi:hypothetical protein
LGVSKLGVVLPRQAAEPPTCEGGLPPFDPPLPDVPEAASKLPKRARPHVRNTRYSDTELAELKRRARLAGMSDGAYTRRATIGGAGPRSRRRPPEIDVALLARNNAELNRIGNNLNQVARALNRDDPERQSVDELRTALLATLSANRRALGHDCEG